MTADQLLLLLPMIMVALTTVVTMLSIAIRRSHVTSCLITALGLLLALLSLIIVQPLGAQEVTPLLLVDDFKLFFTALILGAALAITLLSYPYMANLEDHQDEFYLLISIATLGGLVMAGSAHFITAFVGIEILSVALYGMIAYPLHRSFAAQYPMEASIKYLVLSAMSSAFFLFGVALLYAQTGTLHFQDISPEFGLIEAEGASAAYFVLAALMVMAGFAFKLSLAPFHIWTPDVYEGAPLPATTFLATVGKIAMAALLMRFMSVSRLMDSEAIMTALLVISALSILVGNLLALRQTNLKRLLSYSSIAHMGYLMIAMLVVDTGAQSMGAEATGFYLTAYVVMTLGAFGVMIVVSDSAHERDHIGHYQGLFWRSPWLALVFTAMLLSLAGIPLTIGFIGKFYVFAAGVEGAQWLLLATMVVGSAIGLFYYLRIVYGMLLPTDDSADPVDSQPSSDQDPLPEIRLQNLLPHAVLVLLLAALVIPGVVPGGLMELLRSVMAGLP